MATINYLSLTGLQRYDSSIKNFITEKVNEGDAKSFKYVNLEEGVLKFYTVNPITEETPADFEIVLPEQDLSHLMQLVDNAVKGNIAVFGDNGQVVDGGVALNSLATKAEVDELKDFVGEIPSGYTETTIVSYINKKAEETLNAASGGSSESAASVLAALNTYKAENDPKVAANTEAIEVLNGGKEVEGSVDQKVSAAIDEFATQVTDNNVIDTYREVLNYISTHGGEASAMMAAIDALEELVGSKSVATQIAEAFTEANLDQYATDEELAALVERVVVVEGKAHEHTNKTVLDGITAEKVAAWDAVEGNVKSYVDEKVDVVSGKLGTVEEGKTIVEMIAESEYDDTAVKADVAANAQAIETLTSTHSTDKAALEAKDTEISGKVTALEGSVAALQEVQHVEISESDIDLLFQ